MGVRERYQRGSSRSKGSSTSDVDPKEKLKDCCRKIIAFMCTQVGVGALVFGYTVVGAFSFMHIELEGENKKVLEVQRRRQNYSTQLFQVALDHNTFNKSITMYHLDVVLKLYQNELVELFKHGYDERDMIEVWTFPAALMFSLSIITMIGYGNLVPKTPYGKLAAVVYALFGIPLYVLYFLNVGDALAGSFKWIYRRMYECSTERDADDPPKRIIVPSSACLWVIVAYILTGAIIFRAWESWEFLDCVYFCITSLCKLGFGDYVPGSAAKSGNHAKLVVNFVYILFGFGLVAMCYKLMKEEVREKVKEVKGDFAQCLEDTRMRLMISCARFRSSEEEFL